MKLLRKIINYVINWIKVLYQYFVKNVFNIAAPSLIVTVAIFLYQNYKTNEGIMNLLMATTKYNCAVAHTIISAPSDNSSLLQNFFIVPFITEPYIDNLNFIYSRFGSSTKDHILRAIGEMKEAENLMQIVRDRSGMGAFNQIENIIRFNSNIKTIAPEVIEDLKTMFNTLDVCG